MHKSDIAKHMQTEKHGKGRKRHLSTESLLDSKSNDSPGEGSSTQPTLGIVKRPSMSYKRHRSVGEWYPQV